MKKAFLIRTYKYFQVLEGLNNDCGRDLLLPALVGGLPAIQFSSSYVCIKLHHTMSLPSLGFFFLLYFDMIILIFAVFTINSKVYIVSSKLLSNWKSAWGNSKSSLLRKSLRACVPMKVRFSNNFVDNRTPIVIQDMCVRQTVSLLLLSQ